MTQRTNVRAHISQGIARFGATFVFPPLQICVRVSLYMKRNCSRPRDVAGCRTFNRRIIILHKAILHELDRQRGLANTCSEEEKGNVRLSAPRGGGGGAYYETRKGQLTTAPDDDEPVFTHELVMKKYEDDTEGSAITPVPG
jgi:hypothetical protein